MDEKTIKILVILCVVIFGTLVAGTIIVPVIKLFFGFELLSKIVEIISQL